MYSLLTGCYAHYTHKQELSLAVIGLSTAGKTTFVERVSALYSGREMPTRITPTIGLNVRRADIGSASLRLWDLSGDTSMSSLWPSYYREAHGIIFCIDSKNRSTLPLVQEELNKLVQSGQLESHPLLLLLTKSSTSLDLLEEQVGQCVTESELREFLGLGSLGVDVARSILVLHPHSTLP
eukprot:TRINITY_DN375_c1_g1_i1.p1 TRINITY_DN375_c1_g1~~TRINITY_DN375_c1_g1_i1.p1  ORF type:complete len:181 (-),score=23.61 TRINITY_DN375_c1_g1_i1:126-668(-)